MRAAGLILLAAGGSTRMGRPKQLLPWRGRTLLRHAAETALATRCRPVVVVLGCEADSCRREIAGLDITIVEHARWSSGLGASLAVGVWWLQAKEPAVQGALLMLVDQPGVTPDFLDELLGRWEEGHAIVATGYKEGGGVPAIIERRYFGELGALKGDRGARGLIAREREHAVLVTPSMPLHDLDTPESYRRFTDF
jgi:molybdenum cofactor cytidylyltransferase